jgi:S1-C subfamily serine protease
MLNVAQGQRIDLPGPTHQIRIAGQNQGAFSRLAPFLLPLDADDKLNSACPPVYVGDNRPGFDFVAGQGLDIDLGLIPTAINRLQVVLYVLGGPSRAIGMDHVGRIETIIDTQYCFNLDLVGRREAALILVEFYRRGSGWRMAATGQGFTTGIPGIMRTYGISLDVPHAESGDHDGSHNDEDDARPGDSSGRPPRAGSGATGSGFAVASRIVMTNHHVIEHARVITVTGENPAALTTQATVIASDPVNDIALLALSHDAMAVACFRADHDVELGEDVVVAGFPLQGLLGSGPQVSGGNISALTGIHGNAALLQFNSPIGSGSSGGPMMDAGGHVIGLVTSVLHHTQRNASVAQNMNFGVKASLLRSFLHASGVRPCLGESIPMNRAAIARNARQFLYRIIVEY